MLVTKYCADCHREAFASDGSHKVDRDKPVDHGNHSDKAGRRGEKENMIQTTWFSLVKTRLHYSWIAQYNHYKPPSISSQPAVTLRETKCPIIIC